jgi:hypothetical protein
VTGDASLNVDFANNTTSGSFTNMKAQAAGSNTTTPWNDISLTGTVNRTVDNVSLGGSTSTSGNSGPAGLSNLARGNFSAGLYGPTAQETAGTWALSETTAGGKTAFGTFGGHQ